MSKVLEEQLGKLEYVMLLVITLCVVWLVLRETGYLKEGLTTGAMNANTVGQTVLSHREGLGAYEPPVFWNSGDYAAVSSQQNEDVRQAEGMENNKRAPFASHGTFVEGMTRNLPLAY